MSAITVFLTGECNLACAYCYQTRSVAPGPMDPATRRACAALLSTLGPEGEVVITGGEPLRELEALEELILELERATRPEDRPTVGVISNGLLLDRKTAAFLVRHGVELQLSFDGTRAAQARRGRGSFGPVERRLAMLLDEWPEWSARRLSIAITLDAATVSELADAVINLIERGVSQILVAPLITPDLLWRDATRRELQRQMQRIIDRSVDHYRETGAVPVDFLRNPPAGVTRDARAGVTRGPRAEVTGDARAGSPRRTSGSAADADPADPRSQIRIDSDEEDPSAARSRQPRVGESPTAPRPHCAASSISTLAIDPQGHCWACPALVGSLRRIPGSARALGRLFDLGTLDEGLPRRLEQAREKAARCEDLFATPGQQSADGPCGECRWQASCTVCPAAVRASDGPYRVPLNICHFVKETRVAAGEFHQRLPEIRLRAAMRRWTESLGRMQRALEGHSGIAGRDEQGEVAGDAARPG